MFGYVIINEQQLSSAALERYRSTYCGLCRRLGKRYGLTSRLSLTYDLTFLNVLLNSLYEDEQAQESGNGHCPVHPFAKRSWFATDATDYCADMSIALHYYSAADKWKDDRSPSGLALKTLLKKHLPAIAARCPRQCEAMQRELDALSVLEAEDCQKPDEPADCFGRLLAEVFDRDGGLWSAELKQMGLHLGRFIYLLDAACDLEADRKKGSYNPLRTLAQQPDWQQSLRAALEQELSLCTEALRILPCVTDADILENILYSGVWMRWAAQGFDCPAQTGDAAENGADN